MQVKTDITNQNFRTDPFREGVNMSILQTGVSTCLVKALQRYLRSIHVDTHLTGSGLV